MLILSRKVNESIMIGDNVEISVIDIKGDQVRLGITAPRQVKVYRREVYRMIQEENLQAAKAKPDILPEIPGHGGPGGASRKGGAATPDAASSS